MKKYIFILLAAVLLVSGCQQSEGAGEGREESPPLEEESYDMQLPVELELIELTGEGIRVVTDHPEYGSGIFPEEILSELMFPFDSGEVKAAGDEPIRFDWAGKEIEINPGTVVFSVYGEERKAEGPSFWEERKLYLHGSVPASVDKGIHWNENGLIWLTDRENREPEPARMKDVSSFAGQVGYMTLINRDHMIEKGTEGKDLVNLNSEYPELTFLKNNMQLNRQAAEKMVEMLEDATEEEEIDEIPIVSTYRSYRYQGGVLERRINRFINEQGYDREKATAEAQRIVAVPGSSEHQTGLAVDFTSRKMLSRGETLTSSFYDTPEGDWLHSNSWKYGFILRYPADTEDITGIVEEAWHYRYVGQPHAEIITKKDMVLETYMDFLRREKSVIYEDVHGDCYLILYLDEDRSQLTTVDMALGRVSDTNEGGYVVTFQLPSGMEGCS